MEVIMISKVERIKDNLLWIGNFALRRGQLLDVEGAFSE
jgi:hypothetical protein